MASDKPKNADIASLHRGFLAQDEGKRTSERMRVNNLTASLASVNVLRKAGFDVFAICESSPGISDKQVLKIAQEESRTILTFDRDYGELVFKHQNYPSEGIIYFRWNEFSPNEPGTFLLNILEDLHIEISGFLTVIDRDIIRQRRYL